MLRDCDARRLDERLTATEASDPSVFSVPAVDLSEVQDLDERLQELLSDSCQDGQVPLPEGGDVDIGDDSLVVDPASAIPRRTADSQWVLLDEDECDGKEEPLQVGRCSRSAMNAKRLQVTVAHLPDLGALEPPSDDALWSGAAAGDVPLRSGGHLVESLFANVAGKLQPGHYEVQKAGFSGAWFDFEDLFFAAVCRRQGLRLADARERCARAAVAVWGDDGMGALGADGEAAAAGHDDLSGDTEDVSMQHDEQQQEVVELEAKIAEANQKYESTIRQHLLRTQGDAFDSDQRRFPELYANVRRWQEQLEPVLKDCEARPAFDIRRYGSQVIDHLCELQKEGGVIPFKQVADSQPRWEVCRRFLTCLMLTNHGNTDIIAAADEDRLNRFGIQVLNTEINLATPAKADDEASHSCGVAFGRSRKRLRTSLEAAPLGA